MLKFKLHDLKNEDFKEWMLDLEEVYPSGLFEYFDLVMCPDCPLGCKVVCKHCGVGAFVEVCWFPCKESFIVTRAVCRYGCGKFRWKLEITPTDSPKSCN